MATDATLFAGAETAAARITRVWAAALQCKIAAVCARLSASQQARSGRRAYVQKPTLPNPSRPTVP